MIKRVFERPVQVLAEYFRDPLAGAHHVGRVYRLVGGYQDKLRTAVAVGSKRNRARTLHVVVDRFTHLALEHRHMLVGRGMENHVRLVPGKQLLDRGRIADIAQARRQPHSGEMPAQLHFQCVQVVFSSFPSTPGAQARGPQSGGTVPSRWNRRPR